MMDWNTVFHEEAQKQVFDINQVSLNNIPFLKVSYKKE